MARARIPIPPEMSFHPVFRQTPEESYRRLAFSFLVFLEPR
jgi:hypothetical protein